MGLVEANSDQVTTAYPECLGQTTHSGPLVHVDCVERVVAAGEGANFDNKRSGMVTSDDVDFATGDNHVAGDDLKASSFQVEAGKELAKLSGAEPC